MNNPDDLKLQCERAEAYMDLIGLEVVVVGSGMAGLLRQMGFNMNRVKVVDNILDLPAESEPVISLPLTKGPRDRWGGHR